MTWRAPEHARIRPNERGLTLIELMIALLISSILIGMVFSVYTRMSVAYRGQSDVSELQQTLQAAQMRIVKEVRAAGHLIPNGFALTGVADPQKPLVVENDILPGDADFNSDQITVFYADASAKAAVIAWDKSNNAIEVDDLDDFAVGDLMVVVNPRALPAPPSSGVAAIAEYDACLLQITSLTAPKIRIAQSSAFNSATNSHCTQALNIDVATRGARPMAYRFVARSYRIDPDPLRRSLGILQMSPTGGLTAGDWQDIGIGFTNLQIAVRYFDDDAVDQDGDGDVLHDWYSGDVAPDPKTASPDDDPVPMEVSLGLEFRTTHEINAVGSSKTAKFIVNSSPQDHNPLGDEDELDLTLLPDASRPVQYQGNHVYRWTTVSIDLRNLGVGR